MKEKRRHGAVFRLPARASAFYCAASLISRAAAFITTPLFTRILTEDEYGVLPLYLGWMAIFSTLGTLEIGSGVLYSGFARFKGETGDFTKSALFALLAVYLIFAVPFALLSGRIAGWTELSVLLILIMAVHIPSEAVGSLYCTAERYRYGYKKVFLLNVLPAILAPIISLLLVGKSPMYSRVLGNLTASVTVAVIALFGMRLGKSRVRREMVIHVLKSALILFPALLAAAVLSSSDKLIIGRIFGADAVAKYSVAHSLGLMLTFFTAGLYGALKPWIMRKIGAGEEKNVAVLCEKLVALGSVGTLLLLCIAPELYGLLAPSGYAGGIGAVYFLALAVVPMFLSSVYSSVAVRIGRGALSSLGTVIAALINVVLNLILLPRFSFVFAGFSYLISYGFLAFFGASIAKSNGKIRIRCLKAFIIEALGTLLLYSIRRILLLRILVIFGLLIPAFLCIRSLISEIKEG